MRFYLLDRYIIRKFLSTFFFMVLVLIGVMCTIDFAEKLDDFIEKKAPVSKIVFDYYLNFIPFIANLMSPMCIFLSVIFFTSRMANQSEIISILSSGVNYYRLLLPYLGTSILLGAFSFYLNAYVVPHAVFERLEFEAVYVKNYRPWEARDIHKKITNNTFIYVHAYNQYKKEGTKFTIEEYNRKNLKQKIVAEKARWQPQTGSWKLEQVQIRTLMDSNEVLIFLPFLDTVFELKPDDIYQRENLAESLTLTELIKFTEQERERGSEYLSELILEQHERIAYPFASIILTVIGFSLSTTRKRGGIALQLGIGFVLTFIYLIIQTTAKAAFADSAYPGISMWVPNLIYIILAFFLLRIAPK